MKFFACLVCFLLAGAAQVVYAQETEERVPPRQTTKEPVFFLPEKNPRPEPLPNIGVELGVGFQTFSEELGDVTQAGGSYNIRGIVGTRSRFGLEVGYLGAWNESERQAILDDDENNVFTNAAEAVLRLNFAGNRSVFRPFVGGGVNYTSIDAESELVGALDLDGREGLGFPIVGGLQVLPTKHFMLSARANYTVFSDVFDESLGNQWGASVNWGALF